MPLLPIHAVHSTGELVDGSSARFCGVVSGLYEYASTTVATSSVVLVGMFDLPANGGDGGAR